LWSKSGDFVSSPAALSLLLVSSPAPLFPLLVSNPDALILVEWCGGLCVVDVVGVAVLVVVVVKIG
jgi:hypothetical protein